MQDIANNLLKLREAKNLTQAEMAERLGVSRQTISSWESGRTVPGAHILQEIRNVFGIDILGDPDFDDYASAHNTRVQAQNMTVKRCLLAATVLMSIAHFVGAFSGKASFPNLLSCPILFLFIHLFFHIAFGYCIRNNDYSMIAGYNKETDSDEMAANVLNTTWLFTGIQAVICNILFFGIWFIEENETKRTFSTVLSMVFISFVVIIAFVTKYKYTKK